MRRQSFPAQQNQLAANGEVVNGLAILFGIGNGGGIAGQSRQIADTAQSNQTLIHFQIGFQRHRRSEIAIADKLADGLENALMNRSWK